MGNKLTLFIIQQRPLSWTTLGHDNNNGLWFLFFIIRKVDLRNVSKISSGKIAFCKQVETWNCYLMGNGSSKTELALFISTIHSYNKCLKKLTILHF